MITQRIDIWSNTMQAGHGRQCAAPALDTYILEGDKKRPAVLIFPGSGYLECSQREAEPIALKFTNAGYHAFVLWYRCAPHRHPAPLLDAARAMTIIRENADKWMIDADRIAVMGFSAGGHLAACLAEHYDRDFAQASGINKEFSRPNLAVLCYPVITSGACSHKGSFDNLLGGQKDDLHLLDLLSAEKHVTSDFPPSFIWSTGDDGAVPIENSLLMATALRQAGVPYELHIFPHGPHGIALATEETGDAGSPYVDPTAAQWLPLCINWLKINFDKLA